MSDPLRVLRDDMAGHQISIIRDDGVYRHIRFATPGTSFWRFDLVTWPGHLVITGDVQDFHFARLDDMFEFFRKPVGYINPGYWAEKLCGEQRCKSYSADVFKQRVFQEFWDDRDDRPGPQRELWQAICAEILDDAEIYDENEARNVVSRFRWTDHGRFEFYDTWEWDLTEYDFHFLLSLHAIVWGINWYDSVKAGNGTDAPAVPVADASSPRRTPALHGRRATRVPVRVKTVAARGDLL